LGDYCVGKNFFALFHFPLLTVCFDRKSADVLVISFDIFLYFDSVKSSVKSELDSLGFGLVAIGSGTPLMAKNFQQEYNFQGDIYVDQKRAIYESLGCNRGASYVLNMKGKRSFFLFLFCIST
jgi:hypothetical protein